ncbi:hypothetical protein ACLOJK_003841 [Asimina triloba]
MGLEEGSVDGEAEEASSPMPSRAEMNRMLIVAAGCDMTAGWVPSEKMIANTPTADWKWVRIGGEGGDFRRRRRRCNHLSVLLPSMMACRLDGSGASSLSLTRKRHRCRRREGGDVAVAGWDLPKMGELVVVVDLSELDWEARRRWRACRQQPWLPPSTKMVEHHKRCSGSPPPHPCRLLKIHRSVASDHRQQATHQNPMNGSNKQPYGPHQNPSDRHSPSPSNSYYKKRRGENLSIIKGGRVGCEEGSVGRGALLPSRPVRRVLLQGYAVLSGRGGMKIIYNSPDPTPEWKSRRRFFCLCGASTHLIAMASVPSLPEEERKYGKKECLRKRERSSTKGEPVRERRTNLQVATTPRVASAIASEASMEPDLSFEGFSGLPPLEGTPQVSDIEEERDVSLLYEYVILLRSRKSKLLSKHEAVRSKAARLQEELEVSRAEVTRLQALLREDNVQCLAILEYLCSDIHRRREEFECSHYSQSRYMRASSDITTLHLSIDLSPLYRIP